MLNLLKGDCKRDLNRGVCGYVTLIVLLKQKYSSLVVFVGFSSEGPECFLGFLVLLMIRETNVSFTG